MAINFPANRKVVSDRAKTDVQAQLPTSNPFLKNSFLGALITGISGRIFDFYLQLRQLIIQMFPDTATDDFLVRWGEYVNITRNPATPAVGVVTFTGLVGSLIPSFSQLSTQDGTKYVTTTAATITASGINITTLSRSGGVVNAQCAADHGFYSGQTVTVAGATPSDYNGDQVITVIAADQFQYAISTTPATPATGTISATANCVSVPVQSVAQGEATNLSQGSLIQLSTPIAGVDNNAGVQFNGVSGGADLEDDDDLSVRIKDRYANPIALFNDAAIEAQCKKVPGVTRVFVEDVTPAVGQVTVYFVRDNDTSIIPSGTDVSIVEAKLLEIKPGHVEDADVIVAAPTPVTANFIFTSLSPNTPGMQQAIRNNLKVAFQSSTVGQNFLEIAYQAAIFQSIDLDTGNPVVTFALSSPSGDIVCGDGAIAVLGTVTFP